MEAAHIFIHYTKYTSRLWLFWFHERVSRNAVFNRHFNSTMRWLASGQNQLFTRCALWRTSVRLQLRARIFRPIFHSVTSAIAVVVLSSTIRAEITHITLEKRGKIRNASDDILERISKMNIDRDEKQSTDEEIKRKSKEIKLTPTLNSIVPQSTNMVEFPSPNATRWICVRRKMEQIVVKRPNRKRQTTPAFCAALIFNFNRSGIGRNIMTTSQIIVKMARP